MFDLPREVIDRKSISMSLLLNFFQIIQVPQNKKCEGMYLMSQRLMVFT